ncbi:MAG: hypothetical protein HS116_12065 [Planctomycetes bacterium]|nr:hypothetical protein [Planctomycetota bacterium]
MSRFRLGACFFVFFLALPNGRAGEYTIRLTERPVVWNGTREIPRGIFGVHDMPLTAQIVEEWGIEGARYIWSSPTGEPVVPGATKHLEGCHPAEPPPVGVSRVLDCFFDRYQPALILKSKDWKDQLQRLGSTYGRRARETGFVHTLEFWNEPYLNWASRPGVNYDRAFFDVEKVALDQPMTLRTTGERFENLLWTKKTVAVSDVTGEPHYLATRYAEDYRRAKRYKLGDTWQPFEWKEGFAFDFRGTPCRLKSEWWGRDTTQTSYYSGAFNAEMYIRMLEILAPAVKDAHPGVQLIAGWDCHQFNDDWQPFRTLTRPMIDRCWRWLDGVTEHHYGGDTRMVTAQYEVVSAYVQSKYGKTLKMYNTECGGSADPEQPGVYQTNADAPAIANFTYMARDILHTLAYSPDKIASRAFHQPQRAPGGKEAFEFFKELRGNMLWIENDTPRLWCVASRYGDAFCMMMFNDGHDSLDIKIRLDGSFKEARRVVVLSQDNTLKFKSSALAIENGLASIHIGKRSAVKILGAISSDKMIEPVIRTQYFGDQVLAPVSPDAPITFQIHIPEQERAAADSARLRLACKGAIPTEAEILLNGHPIDFDTRGDDWLCERPVDTKLLKEKNELTFRVREGHSYQVLAASLVVLCQ